MPGSRRVATVPRGACSHHPSVIEIDAVSASRMVEIRWATTSTVMSSSARASRISASTSGSTALVALSSNKPADGEPGLGQGRLAGAGHPTAWCPLTDDRHLGIGEIRHEPIGPGDRQRAMDLLEADSSGDILDDGVGEEERLLEGDRNGSGPVVGGNVIDVDSTNHNRALDAVEDAGDRLEQGRLARTCGTDNRCGRARSHLEVDAPQHMVLAIADDQTVHGHIDRSGRDGGTGALLDRLGHHLVDAIQRNDRRGISSRKKPKTRSGVASRPNTTVPDEVARVASPRDTSQLPMSSNKTTDVGQGIDARLERRSDPTNDQAFLPEGGRRAMQRSTSAAASERLDDQGAFEAFVGDRATSPTACWALADGASTGRCRSDSYHEEREQHDAEQRHKRVNDEQGDDGDDHQGQHTHRKGQRLEHHRGRREVDIGVGEQFTGRPLAMEPQRHIEIVVDEPPPPVAGAVLGKREIPLPHHHADATTHRHHDDQTHDDPDIGSVDRAVVERRDDEVVGGGPKDPRPAD